jgi:hypothetical protein
MATLESMMTDGSFGSASGGGGLDAAEIRAALGMASANLDAQLAAIEAQTDDIGVAGAGLTAIPWNAAWDAEVQSEVTDVVGAAGASLSAIPWNPSWDAEVQSEAMDALNTYDPPTTTEFEARSLPAADYTIVSDLAGISLTIGDNSIDADTLASDLDLYTGTIELTDDDSGTTDHWVVMFRKNGAWLSSGVTSPTLTVTNLSSQAALISGATLTHVGSTIFWIYEATGVSRITSGIPYGVTATATIDGSARTIGAVHSRDTTV